MKIAILEWSCGGGLLGTATDQAGPSLTSEGWQMLRQLVTGLADARLEVHTAVDRRILHEANLLELPHSADLSSTAATSFDAVLRHWSALALKCEYAWIIAPEIDGVLPRVLQRLQGEGHALLNCYGEFLNNCTDKRLTADALKVAGISHPSTIALSDVDSGWIAKTASRASLAGRCRSEPQWIIKPACGAGGAQQRLATGKQVLRGMADATQAWLVQPWLPGHSASCTAIVDAQGERHWLPLVSQDFAHPPSLSKPSLSKPSLSKPSLDRAPASERDKSPPPYIGCTYPSADLPQAAPRDLLEAALDALGPGAFGPVGVDLLFDPSQQSWTVIEVNARCTSSLLAMASAYRGNLAHDICELLTQSHATAVGEMCAKVRPFQFRIMGMGDQMQC